MPTAARPGWSLSVERAKTAIRTTGLTQREVAKHLGIDESKLSKTLAGTRRFTPAELDAFTRLTGTAQESLTETTEDSSEAPSTREQVLTSAARLFSANSYDQVRIADIADAAGVSAASVVYHFNSKPELYLASLHQVTDQHTASFAEVMAGQGSSFAKLYRLTVGQLPDEEHTRRQWTAWMQLWGSTPTHDDVKTAIQESYASWYDTIGALVASAQRDGWLPDGQLLTETLTALIDGLGIRIMSGLSTPAQARTVLHEFYMSRLTEPNPMEDL